MIITITNANYEEVARTLLNAAQRYVPKNREHINPSSRDLMLELVSDHAVGAYYEVFLDNGLNPFAIFNGWDKEEGYPMTFYGDATILENLSNELPASFYVEFTIEQNYYKLAKKLYAYKKLVNSYQKNGQVI